MVLILEFGISKSHRFFSLTFIYVACDELYLADRVYSHAKHCTVYGVKFKIKDEIRDIMGKPLETALQ